MMRSLFSAVSGLRIHQTKMDVIGNNIANVNTVGFKSSRVTFKDALSQTIQGASAPNEESGRAGVNPKQIGLGASLGSIDIMMTQGAAQRTDNPLDLMIDGDAFFVVGGSDMGYRFTRAGNFRLDISGTVHLDGLPLCGWPAREIVVGGVATGEYEIVKGNVEPINIYEGDKFQTPPKASTKIIYQNNISTEDSPIISPGTTGEPIERTFSFFDSLGNEYTQKISFSFVEVNSAGNSEWNVTFGDSLVMNGDSQNPISLSGITVPSTTIEFNTDGKMISVGGAAGTTTFTHGSALYAAALPVAATFNDLTIDFTSMTQYEGKTSLISTGNGYSAGTMTSWSVGPDGKVVGQYTNGATRVLGQIAVATFRNPAALQKVGNNLFITSPNSGDYDGVGVDPTTIGELTGGVLEMSNVDLAAEFTEMITTQRGFQANSRTITTSDDMLQELVNLKR